MFYFLFEDSKQLQKNTIVRKAFEKLFFSKLQMEGYCDINPLIGKPRVAKSELESNLKKIKSPLAGLFSGAYPKNINEIEEKMLPILEKLDTNTNQENAKLDDYSLFAIVYYILQRYKSLDEKMDYIKLLYEKWNESEKEHDIKMSNGIVYDALKVEVNFVSSIMDYVGFMDEIRNDQFKLFFRGHSTISYELQPSLFRREDWLRNEKKMYLELMSKCPYAFEGLNTHIEKLAEMQHYGLPTRLLDITQNPLVALFFACESKPLYRGEIVLFGENRDNIKYSQSDTVALLSSLPLFTMEEQKAFYQASCNAINPNSNFEDEIERLVHEVRMERPGFKSAIDANDLTGAVVCIPDKKNRRIDNQESAFIVCGLVKEIYGKESVSTLSRLRVRNKDEKMVICIVEKKELILKQLDNLGFNKAKIYPEIDDVADYIKTHVNLI